MRAAWRLVAVISGALAIAVLLAGAFALGTRVGAARAGHLGLRGAILEPPGTGTCLPGHGVFGMVDDVDLQARTLAVRGVRGERVLVWVGDAVPLERRGQQTDLAKVKAGELIVVIGAPDEEGRIVARAARVLGGRYRGPAPLWSAAVKGSLRIYHAIELSLRGLLGRMGS